jgi:hypothetical protein
VDVLIDRRELLEKVRQRHLSLQMIEKDHVLGWLLFGISGIPDLVFKGGTALSKVYFPEIWRLPERNRTRVVVPVVLLFRSSLAYPAHVWPVVVGRGL